VSRRRDPSITRRIAVEAARLLAESGLESPEYAKRKAAQRIGCRDHSLWPENTEIETALREHQRLFLRNRQPDALRKLRETALDALQAFAAFRPRLVGTTLDGTADIHSRIRLLLVADSAEDVALSLTDQHIPWEPAEVSLCFSRDRREARPSFRFLAGEAALELVILNRADLSDPPRDPATGRVLDTADRSQLMALLSADQ
jgi:hypothetical protein